MLSFPVMACLLISNMAAGGHFEFPAVAEIAHAGPTAIVFVNLWVIWGELVKKLEVP